MILTILVVLLILWLLGFSFHLAASLTTILTVLLIAALAVWLYNNFNDRNRLP